jgi:hypothetical protein
MIFSGNLTNKTENFQCLVLLNLYDVTSLAPCWKRENLTKITFQVLKQQGHVLHKLLPAERQPIKKLRRRHPYTIPVVKKTRFGRDIIPYSISKQF